jgi:hypothetical protein
MKLGGWDRKVKRKMFKPKNNNRLEVKDMLMDCDNNWKLLQEQDEDCRVKGEIVGRYIAHQIADGNAIYLITKENKRTVKIEVCEGLGDDWKIPAWGMGVSINKDLAIEFLERRDGLAALFAKI